MTGTPDIAGLIRRANKRLKDADTSKGFSPDEILIYALTRALAWVADMPASTVIGEVVPLRKLAREKPAANPSTTDDCA